MANIMDFCEFLAEEGRLAQEYTELSKKIKSKEGRVQVKKLAELSVEKMKILHTIVKNAPWNI